MLGGQSSRPSFAPNLEEYPVLDNSQRHVSLEKARAVAMPAARPALSAICVRHLLRSKMPTGKEVGVGTQSV